MDNLYSILLAIALGLGGAFLVFFKGKRSGEEKQELANEKIRHKGEKEKINEAYSSGDDVKLGNILLRRGKGREK